MSIRRPYAPPRASIPVAETTEHRESNRATDAPQAGPEQSSWLIAEIHKSVTEADAGDFASPQEVREVMNKWRSKADSIFSDGCPPTS